MIKHLSVLLLFLHLPHFHYCCYTCVLTLSYIKGKGYCCNISERRCILTYSFPVWAGTALQDSCSLKPRTAIWETVESNISQQTFKSIPQNIFWCCRWQSLIAESKGSGSTSPICHYAIWVHELAVRVKNTFTLPGNRVMLLIRHLNLMATRVQGHLLNGY